MTTCKNCEYIFEGKFCPNCSQKANTHRFTLLHFGHDFLHALTHTDKGILFLIKELATRPGKVALEYNAGKRKKYFSPITFLLLMSAAQVFVASKTHFFSEFTISVQEWAKETFSNQPTQSELRELDEVMKKNNEEVAKVSENSRLLAFLFIPVLAALTWLFFRKSGYNYAENLILNMMVLGQMMLYFMLLPIVPFLIKPSYVALWFGLYFLLTWTYSFIAYKQFFGQGWGKTIFKGIAVQIIYMIVVQQLTDLIITIIY